MYYEKVYSKNKIIGLCCVGHRFKRAAEKLFCMLAYLPKATVQAAIGGIPLSMGLSCGDAVLSVAVRASQRLSA